MTKKYQNEEWLREQYDEKDKTMSEISDECGVSRQCIGDWCRKLGIKSNEEKKYQNEEWLREEYVEKERTMADIADDFGVTKNCIGYWCKKHSIETRDKQTRVPHHRFDSAGYEEIVTSVDGKTYAVKIHRLVAIFKYGFEAVTNEMDAHHKNGHKFDNRPENIELVKKSEHTRLHHKNES